MNYKKLSPYIIFNRKEWAVLRYSTPLTLSEDDLNNLKGLIEPITLQEVIEIYLPLSRLLNLYVLEALRLHSVTQTFLGTLPHKVPYIIGIAGSVAVGKSTTARVLQELLSHWPDHPKVDLITTDGFLYPNQILEERGIMNRKGFPESYDIKRLIKVLNDIKSGVTEVQVPLYSHLIYDIVPDKFQIINQPDILIVEGVNVLQTSKDYPLFISDFFDFSIYVDADEEDIKHWFLERFKLLRNTAFQNEASYFHRFTILSEDKAIDYAVKVWQEINAINLKENIYPTKQRASLILEKGKDHSVQKVKLRKL